MNKEVHANRKKTTLMEFHCIVKFPMSLAVDFIQIWIWKACTFMCTECWILLLSGISLTIWHWTCHKHFHTYTMGAIIFCDSSVFEQQLLKEFRDAQRGVSANGVEGLFRDNVECSTQCWKTAASSHGKSGKGFTFIREDGHELFHLF